VARRRYRVWNYAMPTTAAPTFVTTGTTIKTMLQVKPTTNISIIQWGFQFDVIPTALVKVELVTTGTIGATVTAYVANDVIKYDDAGAANSAISLGTAASGYTSTAEGTVTATRELAIGPGWSQAFDMQYPLDREPGVQANDFLRIRMTTATAVNAICYVDFEE
jgi:hypothetical protein